MRKLFPNIEAKAIAAIYSENFQVNSNAKNWELILLN